MPRAAKRTSRPQSSSSAAGEAESGRVGLCQLPVQPLRPKATGTQGARPSGTEARPLALWLRRTPLLRSFIHQRGEAGEVRVAALLPLSRTHAAGREHHPRPVFTRAAAGRPGLPAAERPMRAGRVEWRRRRPMPGQPGPGGIRWSRSVAEFSFLDPRAVKDLSPAGAGRYGNVSLCTGRGFGYRGWRSPRPARGRLRAARLPARFSPPTSLGCDSSQLEP